MKNMSLCQEKMRSMEQGNVKKKKRRDIGEKCVWSEGMYKEKKRGGLLKTREG